MAYIKVWSGSTMLLCSLCDKGGFVMVHFERVPCPRCHGSGVLRTWNDWQNMKPLREWPVMPPSAFEYSRRQARR